MNRNVISHRLALAKSSLISVEEWEKTKPPQIEDSEKPRGKGESVTRQGTPQSPELAPRRF